MFTLNDDLSIYATRGDIVFFSVTAEKDGKAYHFQAGDVVRIKVYGKKDAENVVLQKDFPVTEITEKVDIFLTKDDMKIGDVISKQTDYWYEVVLNDDTVPQTIIGYDEDGAKLFRLFPEGDDVPPYTPEIKPEDIPIVDSELDLTSTRPIENQAVARAIAKIEDTCDRTFEAVAEIHITPDMYGAIGDGVSDDSDAFQACFDDSAGKTIVIPDKTYVLKRAIKLNPNIYEYTIRGEAGHRNCYPPPTATKHKFGNISCEHHFLDGTGDDGYTAKYCLKISDINVTMEYDSKFDEKNFLHNIKPDMAIVCGVTVLWADHIIKGGIGGASVIDKCNFTNVRKAAFADGSCENPESPVGFVDSTITNCYINGNAMAGENATLVKCRIFSTMRVTNCYIDYFKDVLSQPIDSGAGYYNGTFFSCCTFDIIWRVFTCGNYRDYVTFDSCHFMKISQEAIQTYFSAPDADILNNGRYTKCGIVVTDSADEGVINDNRRAYIFGICFTNNRVENVDYPFYIGDRVGQNERIVEKGNTYSGYKDGSPVYFWMYPATVDKAKTIYLEAMNGKDYTTLPQLTATFNDDGSVKKVGDIKCFEGMHIFYNGKPAIMHNFRWYDYAGNVLS